MLRIVIGGFCCRKARSLLSTPALQTIHNQYWRCLGSSMRSILLLFGLMVWASLCACNKTREIADQVKTVGNSSVLVNHSLLSLPLHTMLPGTRKNYEALLFARERLFLRPGGKNDTIGSADVYQLVSFKNFQFRFNNRPWSASQTSIQTYHGIVPGKSNFLQTRWEKSHGSDLVYIPKVLEVEASQDIMNKPYRKSPLRKLHFSWEPDLQNTAEQLIVSVQIRKELISNDFLYWRSFLVPDNGYFEIDSLLKPYSNCFVMLQFERFQLNMLERKSGLLLETNSNKHFSFFVSE